MKVNMPDGEPLHTRVTKIGNRWHCRLYRLNVVHDEMACVDQRDIGYCIHEMLRFYDKMGFEPFSDMSYASRHRAKTNKTYGKIYIKNQLRG